MIATLASSTINSQATVVVGDSDLLNAASVEQLTLWLGADSASLKLANIFTKGDDTTSEDFHAAVDGKGATFSVFEATSASIGETYLVGGYDPQSWSTYGDYNYTPDNIDRTAFIFNLTTFTVQRQNKDSDGINTGIYQTMNHPDYGPTFGGGQDIYIYSNLRSGYAQGFSYGENYAGNVVTNHLFAADGFYVGKLEVFSISEDAGIQPAVPEPNTPAMLLVGLAALGAVAHGRKFSQQRIAKAGCQGNSSGCQIAREVTFVAEEGFSLVPTSIKRVSERVTGGPGVRSYQVDWINGEAGGSIRRIIGRPHSVDGNSGDTQGIVDVTYSVSAAREYVVEIT